jgi:hypothetical protein
MDKRTRLAGVPGLVAATLLLGGCRDRSLATEPGWRPTMSLTAPDASASSTICRAYTTRLDRINAQLAQSPAAGDLQRTADAYHRLVADACN